MQNSYFAGVYGNSNGGISSFLKSTYKFIRWEVGCEPRLELCCGPGFLLLGFEQEKFSVRLLGCERGRCKAVRTSENSFRSGVVKALVWFHFLLVNLVGGMYNEYLLFLARTSASSKKKGTFPFNCCDYDLV